MDYREELIGAANVSERCSRAVSGLVLLEHHLGRFDDDGYLVSLLKAQFFRTPPRDYAFDLALSDPDDDMGHNVA